MVKMHDGLYDDMKGNFEFNVEYNYVENQLNIELIDSRSVADQYYGHVAEVLLFSDEDLHTTRNLYLHSSVLASYDTLSKFKMDAMFKPISVRAKYNELIFDSSMAGFDYLDVSRRSFQRVDSRLTDY